MALVMTKVSFLHSKKIPAVVALVAGAIAVLLMAHFVERKIYSDVIIPAAAEALVAQFGLDESEPYEALDARLQFAFLPYSEIAESCEGCDFDSILSRVNFLVAPRDDTFYEVVRDCGRASPCREIPGRNLNLIDADKAKVLSILRSMKTRLSCLPSRVWVYGVSLCKDTFQRLDETFTQKFTAWIAPPIVGLQARWEKIELVIDVQTGTCDYREPVQTEVSDLLLESCRAK